MVVKNISLFSGILYGYYNFINLLSTTIFLFFEVVILRPDISFYKPRPRKEFLPNYGRRYKYLLIFYGCRFHSRFLLESFIDSIKFNAM